MHAVKENRRKWDLMRRFEVRLPDELAGDFEQKCFADDVPFARAFESLAALYVAGRIVLKKEALRADVVAEKKR